MGTDFKIKIADCSIKVSALFSSTRDFCRDYLTEENPVFSISILPQDISFEREKSIFEAKTEDDKKIYWSDEYLERLAVYRKIAVKLLDFDTLLFHGSVIAVDGNGYLFTAKSGTGKSTHTRLWRKMLGKRAVMINDDKPLLKLMDQGVYACGTPWNGKHSLGCNLCVPLEAICILERSEINQIGPVSKKEALPVLIQQSYRPTDMEAMGKTLSLVDRLSNNVRLYRLYCNMEPEAAKLAYKVMHG